MFTFTCVDHRSLHRGLGNVLFLMNMCCLCMSLAPKEVQRKQFPLMPGSAMPLYSMQGTTAEPGMVAYWAFPQRYSPTIKWLIVYVMLSRPRCLASLQSVRLTDKVRSIIEEGPQKT